MWSWLAKGVLTTSGLILSSTSIGLLLRIGAAALRSGVVHIGSIICAGLVEIVRNTPFVLQLFLIVSYLLVVAIKLSAGQAAIIAMSINLAAYNAASIHAGINATGEDQREAGRVLGSN